MERVARSLLALQAALELTATLGLVVLLVAVFLRPGVEPGLRFEVISGGPDPAAPARPRSLAFATLASVALDPNEPFAARWSGVWRVTKTGRHRLAIATDGVAQISVDGEIVVSRRAEARRESTQAALTLASGSHQLAVELQGPARQLQPAPAERNRAGGHDQEISPPAMEPGDVSHERL